MSNYRIPSLPPGVHLDGCTVARSPSHNGNIFIKIKDGRIFNVSRWPREIDLLADCGSNIKDRSVYAKLAGITLKELEAARKAARDKEAKARRAFDLRRLKSDAAKLGMKVTKA